MLVLWKLDVGRFFVMYGSLGYESVTAERLKGEMTRR